jgi:hypothetical protein
MKKVIIGLSAVLLIAFVVILAVSAKSNPQETKKCGAVASKECSKGADTTACCKMKYGSTAATGSDKAACKEKAACEAKCKEGKCPHESGNSATASTSGEAKKCCQKKAMPGSQN